MPRDRIIEIYQDPNFKLYVRKAVSEDTFLTNFFKELQLQSKIEYEVRNQLNNKLDKVKSTLESSSKTYLKNLKDKARNEINRDFDLKLTQEFNKIPGMVALEISKQMPGFLGNNSQMQQILQNHSTELNNQLEKTAKSTLDRIVNEEQYHKVTNVYTKAIEQKGDDAINQQWNHFNSNLNQMKEQANQTNRKLTNTVNQTTNNLSYKLQEFDSLKMNLSSAQRVNKENESRIGFLETCFKVAGVALLSLAISGALCLGNLGNGRLL